MSTGLEFKSLTKENVLPNKDQNPISFLIWETDFKPNVFYY